MAFSLGLERTGGFKTVAFCEIDPFCRRVLAKHWPEVPCYDDVRTLTADRLRADGIAVDVICGGFPCQDISRAGSGLGLEGARSGLWSHYARLIGEIRPGHVLVENVAALLGRGMDKVLGTLATIGYDAEWHCISAGAVGAPHIRDRVWLVAYPQHPHSDRVGSHQSEKHDRSSELRDKQGCLIGSLGSHVPHPHRLRELEPEGGLQDERRWIGDSGRWNAEPAVGRVAYGVSDGVDRIKSLGNAVVPQIPELIGRAILASLEPKEAA